MSDTFAPPSMATKGLSGFSSALPIIEISFSIKYPATDGRKSAIPAVDECALCAVPNASFTNISPRLANFSANPLSFLVSPFTNLTFSKSKTSPSLSSAESLLALSPTTSPSSAK